MQTIDYKNIIEDIYRKVKSEPNIGSVASYIPGLSGIDPDKFGICLTTLYYNHYSIGDYEEKFSIQSIAKVLSLSLAYSLLGETIWDRLGVEPAGTPFNSLVQLETDKGIPRNPFINSGAMVVCDILTSLLKNPKEEFIEYVRKVSDNPSLNYSVQIAESEKSTGYRNVALCNFIKSFGNIKNEPDKVLDFYFNMCSIEMTCRELSEAFLFLVNAGAKASNVERILTLSQSKRMNALMQTCGFYGESGEFAFKVGLPGKSGVGGGIIAIHPHKYSIAIWSPKLNKKGNSHRGMKFLEAFTTKTQSSIF